MLNIVIIGVGMYSTGRGTDNYGTVLPAVNEWRRRHNKIESKIIFVGTDGSYGVELEKKFKNLAGDTGVDMEVSFYPEPGVVDLESYKKVIKDIPRPACAIVVVPDHLHFQVSYDCLMENLPLLVVKPLTPTKKEGQMLAELAHKRRLYAAVEFHKRWDKANLMIKEKIQSGYLGDLLYCWVEYSQRKSIPVKTFKAWVGETSILQYLGIHYIDVIRFCTGAFPRRVMAVGQKKWLLSKGIDAYDSIQCTIEWEMENGHTFSQTILTNWIDPESSSSMSDQKIKIVGTKGRFESDQKERGIRINTDDHGIEQPNPDFCCDYINDFGKKVWRGYGIDSIKTFLEDVVSINNAETDLERLNLSRPTFSEATISTAVVESAHKSLLNNNNWQSIDL